MIDFDNVRLLSQDALRNKNNLSPAVLDVLRSELAAGPDRKLKLVANLPYNVATPIISNLLAGDVVPTSMTVTIQKELGDRIMARPSTKDYSALSVWMQSQCRIELVRVMPPSVFWPRPKVNSAILHIEVDESLRCADSRPCVLSRICPRDVLPPPQVPAQRAGQRLQGTARQE